MSNLSIGDRWNRDNPDGRPVDVPPRVRDGMAWHKWQRRIGLMEWRAEDDRCVVRPIRTDSGGQYWIAVVDGRTLMRTDSRQRRQVRRFMTFENAANAARAHAKGEE